MPCMHGEYAPDKHDSKNPFVFEKSLVQCSIVLVIIKTMSLYFFGVCSVWLGFAIKARKCPEIKANIEAKNSLCDRSIADKTSTSKHKRWSRGHKARGQGRKKIRGQGQGQHF